MADQVKRQISIYLNGKQVANNLKQIRAEKRKINAELNQMEIGSKEYVAKMKELRRINGILGKHRREMRGVERSWGRANKGISKFIPLVGAAFAADAIIGYGKELFKLSAQMEILAQKAETVFAQALPSVTHAAKENATAMGLTTSSYVDAAAAIGDLLIPMGFQREEAAAISTELVNLSGALSEWTGGQISAANVTQILGKAMLGEREQLKQLGIAISEADVKARIAEKGLENLTGTLLQQAKAAATLELITEKSIDAQEAYLKNSDKAVRKQAQINAQFREAAESLAETLLPVFKWLAQVSYEFAQSSRSISDFISGLINPAGAAVKAWEEQNAVVLDLERNIEPLIDRYEELTGKTDLTNDEQEELNRIIGKISERIPGAVIQFDEYGNAIKLSADQAKKFIETQRAMAEVENQKAIEKNEAAVKKLRQEYEKLNDFLNKGALFYENYVRNFKNKSDVTIKQLGGFLTRKATQEDFEQLRTKLKELNTELIGTEAILNKLKGKSILGTDLETPTSGEVESTAERQAREAREQRLREQREKEAKELERHLTRLREMIEKNEEAIFEAGLSEDDRETFRIVNKYKEQFELISELEKERGEEVKELRIELERQLDMELQQLNEERAEREKEMEAEKLLARQEFIEQLTFELADEQEQQVILLEQYYDRLLQQAEEYGLETEAIEAHRLNALKELNEKFLQDKEKVQIKEGKKEIKFQQDLFEAQTELELAKIGLYQNVSEQLRGILGKNQDLAVGLFLFEKGLAAAEVIINLQKEIAAISQKYAGIPFVGAGLAAAEIAIAKTRAAASLAVIGGTVVQKIFQRKEGGWFDVQGADDNRTYHAQYIGRQSTGMLPGHPVVLASEAGPEYFVSNRALQHPDVFNHVRAIENITRTQLPQFQQGGFTDIADPIENPSDTSFQNSPELVAVLGQLVTALNRGVIAIIPDETVVDLVQRFNTLNDISGGVLDTVETG